MPTDERQRLSIPPGDMLGLFEKLGIKSGRRDAFMGAATLFTNYVSNRSVALLLRSSPDHLEVGSGVCVRIANRYLAATVKHNLQDDRGKDLRISDIEVLPRGEKYGEPLKVQRIGLSPTLDLAWLEFDPEVAGRANLAFVTTEQIAFLREEDDKQPCFVAGYPAQSAGKPPTAKQRPSLELDGVLTLSIAPNRRQSPNEYGTFAIEYPPHDRSLDDDLPLPHGVSGGGAWLFPRFDDNLVWLPESSRLVGILRSWRKDCREAVVMRIERWLELVASQIPEASEELERLALAEIVRRLADAYRPRAIYLFGSRARHDHRPRSDYDLLVVVPDGAPRELRSSRKAYECLRGTGRGVDVLVCTQDYFASREHVRTSIPARVMREGKVLYAA